MSKPSRYLDEPVADPVSAIVKAIDHDVARGEDILMFGFALVMLSSTFAPVAPPTVILPLVALTFAVSSGLARWNYHAMERKLKVAMGQLERRDKMLLRPIASVFAEQPMPPLIDSYNFFKNWRRTWKSVLGGIVMNPLWMPIFYAMGIQIGEEKNLIILNRAICLLEQKIAPPMLVGGTVTDDGRQP
jgi:hypothetical protein